MMPRKILPLLLILILALLSALAPAEEPDRQIGVEVVGAPTGERVALVIGNGAYKSSPLKNPPNDARAMSAVLRACGFLVIEKIDVGLRDMKESVREFGQIIRGKDCALFFYAGHGLQLNGRNYLVPVDAAVDQENMVEYECMNAGRVLARMESAGCPVNIVVLDACRNNPFARSWRATNKGLAEIRATRGSLIAYATSPGSVAADGAGSNSYYTESLLKHLRTPGLKVEEVFKRVRSEVYSATDEKQIPWEHSSLMGDFYFIPRDGALVQPVATPLPFEAPVATPRPTARPSAPAAAPSRPGTLQAQMQLDELTELFQEKDYAPEKQRTYYQAFVQDYSGTPAAETAHSRIREIDLNFAKAAFSRLEKAPAPETEVEGRERKTEWEAYLREHGKTGYRVEAAREAAASAPSSGLQAEKMSAARQAYGRLAALAAPKTEAEGKARQSQWLAYVSEHAGTGYKVQEARQKAEAAPVEGRLNHAKDFFDNLMSKEGSYPKDQEEVVQRQNGWEDYLILHEKAGYRIAEAKEKAHYYKTWQRPFHGDVETFDLGGGVSLEMVYIEGGTFEMGSPSSESGRDDDEGPVHPVELDGFWMGKYEVTQEQYQAIMGSNPSSFSGSKNPVEKVTWNDAKDFCERLSRKTGKTFRLPTEAEWEYACRAGTRTAYSWGDQFKLGVCNAENDVGSSEDSNVSTLRRMGLRTDSTTPVGSFKPNPWGLHDMIGNVWEWCGDWYDSDYYENSPRRNPTGPSSGSDRVIRGGGWINGPEFCRSATRDRIGPGITYGGRGFRVALSPVR